MRDFISRVRAVLTPQALAVLALALVLIGFLLEGSEDSMTDLERRTARTLSGIPGAGNVRVVIRTKTYGERTGALQSGSVREIPCGAAACAGGASDPLVRLQLQEALCALLGLPASAVSIVQGGE